MKCLGYILLLLVALLFTSCHSAPSESVDAKSCYEAALAALANDSSQLAQQLLRQAVCVADGEDDLHTSYLAQLQLAQLLAEGNSASALEMARQALQTYERRPDNERNHIILLDYVATYASQLAFDEESSFDEALSYAHRACELAQASCDTMGTELLSQTLTTQANIHWAMEDYVEALRFAKEATKYATPNLLSGTQQVLARCFVSCDSLEQAEAIYRNMQAGDDSQMAYIIHSNLARLAVMKGEKETALEALDETFDYAEELYFSALQKKDAYYQTLLNEERANEHLRYASMRNRYLFAGILLLLTIALIASVFGLRARARVSAQQRLAEVWKRKHEVDEHLRGIRSERDERTRLEQEMIRQDELLRQRNATIGFLQDFVLQRSAVIQKLGYSNDRYIVLNDHEWREVEQTLNAIDDDRFARLRQRFPNMSQEDIRLCILTRLRLSNRAIGNIYAISISAVQHRKLRLKKEVFGQEDPNTTLEQVLAEQ